jgi:PAS domain S-box-containing protein
VLPSEILSSVLNSAPDAMLVVDASGSIVFLNRQVSTLFGYEASELKGRRIEMLVPDRFRTRHVQHCQSFVENERRRPMGIGLELFALRKDGTEFPVEVSLSPIADETGVLVIAAIRDLTERKRAEAALQERLEVHRTMLGASLDGYTSVDAGGRVLDVNPAYVLQSGYTRDELVGMHISELEVVESTAEIAFHLKKIIATGSDVFESAHRRKDGSTWQVEISVTYSKHRGGQFHSFYRDITERKRAEAALRASEAYLRTIVETEPDCVKVLSPDGQLLELNSAGLAMFEVDSIEQANEHGLLNSVCPEYRSAFRDTHQAVMGGARGELEFEIVGFKGTRRWLQCHSAPMRDATGAVVARLAIARDITERKQLESAVLKASNREQQRLGHELHDGLGQDLTGISLLAAALGSSASQGKGPGADELMHLATMTGHAIATCRAIARGLTPVNDATGGLVQALDEMVTVQRESHRVDVRFETVAAAPIRLPTDVQDHLYRIAQEAVTNAQKHGRAELIKVTLNVEPTLVQLEVLDNGVGLAPAGAPSTGMGLKIMRYRAAMIGARLSIGRADSGGTLIVCQCLQLE